jgi:maleate isomerase
MSEKVGTIGVIWPGRLEPRYEWARLGPWLARRGLRLRIRLAESPSDGLHDVASLEATGAPATLAAAAARLRPAGCASVLWACTSGSFIAGREAARRQAAAIAAAAGAPATSTSLALLAAAAALGADRVALLSPYPEAATERLAAFLAEAGVTAGALRMLGCASGELSNALDLAAEAADFAATPAARGLPLMVPDTAINALDLVAPLEAALGRPVIAANHASLWHALALAGRPAAGLGGMLAGAGPA